MRRLLLLTILTGCWSDDRPVAWGRERTILEGPFIQSAIRLKGGRQRVADDAFHQLSMSQG